MRFWSKGLGEKTVDLFFSKGEPAKSGETLYLIGQMEAPVSWDYIMPLSEDDIIDFFALLKEPAIAEYLHRSPDRWRIYGTLVVGGLHLGLLALLALLRGIFVRGAQEEPIIQVPPPIQRRGKRPVRRRLGAAKPSPDAADAAEEPEEPGEPEKTGVTEEPEAKLLSVDGR
jgi:hypothetical protein